MADIAELGIRVTLNEQGQVVARQLDAIAQSGAKLEQQATKTAQSVRGLAPAAGATQQQLEFLRKTAEQLYLVEQNEFQAVPARLQALMKQNGLWQEYGAIQRQIQQEVTATNAVMAAQAPILNTSNIQFGRLRGSITSMLASLTGSIPGVAQVGSVLAQATIGAGATVAALGAIAGVVLLWERFTNVVKGLTKEQEKATDAAIQFSEGLHQSKVEQQIDALNVYIASLQKVETRLLALKVALAQFPGASALAGLVPDKGDELAKATQARVDAIQRAGEEGKAMADRNLHEAEAARLEALEVEHLRALNAAHGASKLSLALISIEYERQAGLVKNLVNLQGAEREQADARVNAMARAKAVGAQLEQQDRQNAAALAAYNKEAAAARKEQEAALSIQDKLARAQALNEAVKSSVHAYDDLRIHIEAVDAVTAAGIKSDDARFDSLVKMTEATIRLNDETKRLAKTADDGKQTLDAFYAFLDKVEKAQEQAAKYSQDIRNIWASGLEKIATDGTKSFADFFEDVLRLFQNLMRRMQEEGKTAGLGYQLLGLGSAALTGISIGTSSGNPLSGLGGGALAGATIAGPAGAFVGGLAGLVGGVLGESKRMDDARKQFQAALKGYVDAAYQGANSVADAVAQQVQQYTALKQQLEAYAALAGVFGGGAKYTDQLKELTQAFTDALDRIGKGLQETLDGALASVTGNDYQNQLAAAFKQYSDFLQAINALGQASGDSAREARQAQEALDIYNRTLAKLAAEEAQRTLVIAQDFKTRELAARGLTEEAAAADFAAKQQRELFQAMQDGYTAAQVAQLKYVQGLEAIRFAADNQVAALERQAQGVADQYNGQIDVLNKQLSVQTEALRSAQETAKATRQTADALTGYAAGLRTNNPSNNPETLLQIQRAQLGSLYQSALGGDQQAAQQFSGAADAYLQTLRTVYASGSRATSGYADVQQMADTLAQMFGTQATQQESAAAQIQQQVDLAQKQVDMLTQARDAELAGFAQEKQAILDAAQQQIDEYVRTHHLIETLTIRTDALGDRVETALAPITTNTQRTVERIDNQTAVLSATLETGLAALAKRVDELAKAQRATNDTLASKR